MPQSTEGDEWTSGPYSQRRMAKREQRPQIVSARKFFFGGTKMYPRATFRYLAPLLAMASLSTLTACGSGSSTTDPPPPPAQSPVNHIIFLSEENRSFDHY